MYKRQPVDVDFPLFLVRAFRSAKAEVLLPFQFQYAAPADVVHIAADVYKRQEVMDDFKSGRLDALVSTTVIEVGVDVPNAPVMVIENAERYGLDVYKRQV